MYNFWMCGRIRIRRGLRRSSVPLIIGAGLVIRWFIDDDKESLHILIEMSGSIITSVTNN
jgi:hypothetical protein